MHSAPYLQLAVGVTLCMTHLPNLRSFSWVVRCSSLWGVLVLCFLNRVGGCLRPRETPSVGSGGPEPLLPRIQIGSIDCRRGVGCRARSLWFGGLLPLVNRIFQAVKRVWDRGSYSKYFWFYQNSKSEFSSLISNNNFFKWLLGESRLIFEYFC
jgi:hypothetical protein